MAGPGLGMGVGSGAGWPNRNPWPMVAPAATASRACLMVSMPSATTTASVRSAWARTTFTMWAASVVVRPWSRRMSSLIRSGRTNGSTARVAGAAPTSSRATPQPAWRAWATVASSRAGSPLRARSVTSTTTRSRPRPSSMAALRSSGQATPSETGSALTNRVSGGPSPPRTASVKAAARQAQSSSATRPARQAAPNRAAGVSRAEASGPRASAS
jgi:hypothetical protein